MSETPLTSCLRYWEKTDIIRFRWLNRWIPWRTNINVGETNKAHKLHLHYFIKFVLKIRSFSNQIYLQYFSIPTLTSCIQSIEHSKKLSKQICQTNNGFYMFAVWRDVQNLTVIMHLVNMYF